MTPKQEAAYEYLRLNPELTAEALGSLYELTFEEACEIVDYFHVWRGDF